ncbi:MAG: serine/threonine protein kinase, partial [Planctomycetota bacterium]
NIVARIGSGGMGIVYLAEHAEDGHVAAVKVLKPGLDSASAARRFSQEIEILRRLDHPGIAKIYNAGTVELAGVVCAYYAMEHVAGRHIIRHAEINDLSVSRRLELVAMVCDALAHAHDRGVLHRDLKPHNILVESPASPKLLDFGVARVSATVATTMHTQVGQILGTVQYMAPEQIAGRHDELDQRADVYALGVVLYELLCGRLPYSFESHDALELLRAMREDQPTPPRALNERISEDTERLVLTAMARSREQRYPSAAALASDLRLAAAGKAIKGVESIVTRPNKTGIGAGLSRLFRRAPGRNLRNS